MFYPESRLDEREAACIVAGLHGASEIRVGMVEGTKRVAQEDDDGDDGAKRSRKDPAASSSDNNKPKKARKDPPMDATGLVFAQPELKPAPYFYYSDHSLESDDDPLMPITSVGSVPTFPASELFSASTRPPPCIVPPTSPVPLSFRLSLLVC